MHCFAITFAILLLLLPCSINAQPPRPTCGTFLQAQLEEQKDHLDEKGQALLRSLQSVSRLNLHKNIVSYNGHFRIHYDTSGPRAPSQVDKNNNGVPDYIDSVDYYMELAWQKEIEECGYTTPPPDNVRPGVGGIDGRIDVYIDDLAPGLYGLAQPETSISGNRSTGYIHLDNDYSENYPTPGIDGLRVSTAHEFHHIVQFSSYRHDLSQASLYESTATWMEYKVHPDLADFVGYFNALLAEPHLYAYATHNVADAVTGYGHMNYLQSLVQQLDETIVRDIWDEFKANGRSFDAINQALLKTGSGLNLSNSYCTFARWSYFTGANSKEEPYFAKPEQYGTIVPAQIRSMPLDEETSFVSTLMPLSFGVWRLTIPRSGGFNPDTVDFLVTNARSDLGTGGIQWLRNNEPFTLDVSRTAKTNYLPVSFGTEAIYYRLTAPHPNFCVEVIVNGSAGVTTIALPTPQPFVNDGADRMVFAVQVGAETVISDIKLDIYSSNMTPIATIRQPDLETLNNLNGIIWDGRDRKGNVVPSGVYIYTLQINNSEPSVGKFAVIKK